MTIRLPEDPKEYEYEDLVLAALTAYGYFVETRLELKKDGTDILEFDTVATPANAQHEHPVLVEAKSANCSIADMFKLSGQSIFTDIKAAWLAYGNPVAADKEGAIKEVEAGTCVQAIHVTKDALLDPTQYPLPLATDIDASLRQKFLGAAWWGRLADREVQARFISWTKSHGRPPPEFAQGARDYDDAVAQSFFKQGPLRRAHALYDAYKAHPSITTTTAGFMATPPATSQKVVKSAWTSSKHYPLQHLMMQEQRARVRLIKNALDGLFFPEVKKEETDHIDWQQVLTAGLPESFKTGMASLEKHEAPHLVPYFFQVFVEALGGFYFPDDEKDAALLSELTGIEPDNIEATLRLYDAFFPRDGNSWLHAGNGIMFLKSVPAYMKGVGCFFRNSLYDFEKYADRFPSSGDWMVGWHNALYELLRKGLGVQPGN